MKKLRIYSKYKNIPCKDSKKSRLRGFLFQEDGATTIEYSLIVALVSLLIFGAIANVGTNLSDVFRQTSNALTGATSDNSQTGAPLAVNLQNADLQGLMKIRLIGETRANNLLIARDNGLNLNTASKSELEAIPQIGSVLAERIIRYRTEGCVEDVCN